MIFLICFVLINFILSLHHRNKQILKIMTSKDLKKGSIVEVRVNLSPNIMNEPIQVEILRTSEKYLWFKYNSLQRIGRTTFDNYIKFFNYKIISI